MSSSRRTYRYRLYPSRAQVERLEATLATCCELYNAALAERREAWKRCGVSIGFAQQSEQLPEVKQARPDCSEVFSQVLQDVLRRVDKTFKAFFRRCQQGEKPGFPRFRSRQRYDSLTYPQLGFDLNDRRLALSKIGHLKIKLHRPLDGKVKTCTIKREAGRWYACFSCEVEPVPLPVSAEAVGIDLGLDSFAVLSDGTEIDNPKQFRHASAKLRRAQRKVARRKKGSFRQRQAVRELQRVHARVRNQRADFHHKLAGSLICFYGLIVVEDLNIKGLAGGVLSKSVSDAGWSGFLQKLAYKAADAGRELVRVDARGTSQRCVCGRPNPKRLSQRWHRCECGLSVSRDHAAALEILRMGLGRRLPTGCRNVRCPEKPPALAVL